MEIAIFGKNVRSLRDQQGLSLSEMAEKLELTEELLLLLESGILTEEMDIRILEHLYFDFGIMPGAMFAEEPFSTSGIG